MTFLRTLAETLTESLHLSQPPVAISFTDTGSAPAGCRFWQDAANRVFATVGRDHALCAIGVYTHNLESSGSVQTVR